MATSGSADFDLTANQIIEKAYRITGVVESGLFPDAAQTIEARIALNALVKDLQNTGVRLWTVEEVSQDLKASSEVIGTDTKNYRCILSHTSTTDDEPITGKNHIRFWTQDGTAGVAWAAATAFGSVGDFSVAADTIGIQKIYTRENNTDHPITLISRQKFHDISSKKETGIPRVAFFDVRLAPIIRLYPQSEVFSPERLIIYLRERMIEDFDTATDNPDFRSRWIRFLSYGLAEDLGEENQIDLDKIRDIRRKSGRLLLLARNSDREFVDHDVIRPYGEHHHGNL